MLYIPPSPSSLFMQRLGHSLFRLMKEKFSQASSINALSSVLTIYAHNICIIMIMMMMMIIIIIIITLQPFIGPLPLF
jgi:hypothetical protein